MSLRFFAVDVIARGAIDGFVGETVSELADKYSEIELTTESEKFNRNSPNRLILMEAFYFLDQDRGLPYGTTASRYIETLGRKRRRKYI